MHVPTSVGDTGQWLRLGALLLGLFAVLTAMVVGGWTQGLDDAWNTAMTEMEVAWLVSVAEIFHATGGVVIGSATTVVVAIGFVVTRRPAIGVAWIGIVAGSRILSTVSKALIDRERPLNGLVHESSAAYPSGHAMVAGAAIGIGLAVLLGMIWPQRNRLLLSIGVIYAVLMAWSRVYLRAHWLTDVIGGLLFGSVVVIAVAVFLRSRNAIRYD